MYVCSIWVSLLTYAIGFDKDVQSTNTTFGKRQNSRFMVQKSGRLLVENSQSRRRVRMVQRCVPL
jgi:hypothetical protein